MKYNFSSLALVNANERKVKKEIEEKKLKIEEKNKVGGTI